MKVLLAGATGFIGQPLLQELRRQNHELFVLSRNPSKVPQQPSVTALAWDGKNPGSWFKSAEGADAVINLSGAGIADKRWSAARKKELIDSRIDSTRVLIEFMKQASKKPSVFINASAVGFYGDVPEGDVPESHAKGTGFLADVCEKWENEAKAAEGLGIRTVLLRTGIVLERGGGALAKMEFPFKIYAGGPLGSGKQWFPWIHREDEIGMILFALENPSVHGPLNVTAPNPVTMKDFCKALGKSLHRPSWAPVPGFMLYLLLGEMAGMLLGGQKALPQKAQRNGYRFKHPELQQALDSIVKK